MLARKGTRRAALRDGTRSRDERRRRSLLQPVRIWRRYGPARLVARDVDSASLGTHDPQIGRL